MVNIEQAVLENLRLLSSEKQHDVLVFIKSLLPSDLPPHQILRVEATEKILPDLQRIQWFHDGLPSAVYASGLLQALQDVLAQFPDDPLSKFLKVLYDTMSVENCWGKYSATYYQLAHNLLSHLIEKGQSIQDDDVTQAIEALEQAAPNLMNTGVVTDADLDDVDEY
jgi:hypothetical protein